ncbi:hypothetical protein C7999DRAFT_29389 [Corynascus novoguineensis]|uniref:Myb-like DNA-binding domain-containing protein n=1 Tax=Corynascus novoguineensis TaxID=1126955 RepID=A0AAN7CXI2_9PEZI|nr:hypothetical protein C7999DRAFT_29389 [Corynascus novoguineensis]
MPAIDTEAQFKFLLCCIKHSAAGKVNFDNVAQELDIVSKAAAAKRYERLLKAHNISPATPRKGFSVNVDAGDETGEPKTPASKKRKRTVAAKREDEDGTPVKKERAVKKETNFKKEESDDSDVKVKGEEDGSSADSINTATVAITPSSPSSPSSPSLSCYVGGVGARGELPGTMPQRQDLANHRHNEAADDGDDGDCIVICERPVALLPSPATIACQSSAHSRPGIRIWPRS